MFDHYKNVVYLPPVRLSHKVFSAAWGIKLIKSDRQTLLQKIYIKSIYFELYIHQKILKELNHFF